MLRRHPQSLLPLAPLLGCLLLLASAGCIRHPAPASPLHRLQGHWEGEGPPGKISIRIRGNHLHFHARPDFWYETTFTLPAGTDPPQLHATIQDSSAQGDDLGQVVVAIFELQDRTLTLGVDDGSDVPPASLADAMSRYMLKRVQTRQNGPASRR